ncbi:HEPN domain-containing protein [Desulfonatronospira sp.]|uniref:HEPN domain-containing protein n=1 Tax=Desulfonatronospira sp. TaxID=1962951 RepID=UPI0025C58CCB|nr:HEPN domain-containing protein [Desulfonatronospira sp.]
MQSSQEDLEVAEQLLHSGKIRHGLFFLHLALEKALKAHVCNKTMDIAPRTHNLVRLAELADLKLAQQQRWVLADMNPYNLEGRYPHILSPIPDKQEVLRLLCKSKETIQWLKRKL